MLMQSTLSAQEEALIFLAHELKGPASVIVAGAKQVRSFLPHTVGQEAVEALDCVEEASLTLTRTIDQLAAVGSAAKAVEPEPILVQRIAEQVTQRFRIWRPERRIIASLPSALPPVLGNAFFVETVLQNLLRNADEHSGLQEPIEIAAALADRELWLTVRDKGEGIEESELGEDVRAVLQQEQVGQDGSWQGSRPLSLQEAGESYGRPDLGRREAGRRSDGYVLPAPGSHRPEPPALAAASSIRCWSSDSRRK
jgi:K+-sensing histidine kinase KdpD